VSPYLWYRSIGHLDVVVATHAHQDHTGGLGAILDNFHPPAMWTGAHTDEPVWNELSRHARRRGVKIAYMHGGQALDFGGAHIEVLSPPEDYLPNDTPKNNDSLAFRVTYGRHAFLLTGDMEKPMENRLLADGRALRADVLKVGHHGSKTSSSELFLDAIAPRFAIISDGFENSFGHPNRDVLERLTAHHATILRTDIIGLITIRTDGHHLSMTQFGSK
jgi:competence protein ComEC